MRSPTLIAKTFALKERLAHPLYLTIFYILLIPHIALLYHLITLDISIFGANRNAKFREIKYLEIFGNI